jgi:hypothetical protein
MPWAALAAAGGSMIGGIAGSIERSNARDQQMRLIQASIDDLKAIGIPPIEAQQMVMEQYRSAGELDPELEQVINQQNTGMQDINIDPRLKEAQLNALSELQGIGQSGGMRLSDQAAAEGALGRIQSQERGSREAIAQNLREKNQFGGGDELAMQLANQQNSAQNANQIGLGLAGQAQQNALQAIMQGGQLGGQMQGQEFSQQAQIKQAQDAINRFNAQNSQDVSSRNVGRQNEAQGWNLQNKQNIMNQNTSGANQAQQYNKGLIQQQFENQMNQASALGNIRNQQATAVGNYGDKQAQMYGQMGQGINQAASAYAASPNRKSTGSVVGKEKKEEE